MKRRNFSFKRKTYWETTMARQRGSGLTAKQYCRRCGLALSSFYNIFRQSSGVLLNIFGSFLRDCHSNQR